MMIVSHYGLSQDPANIPEDKFLGYGSYLNWVILYREMWKETGNISAQSFPAYC